MLKSGSKVWKVEAKCVEWKLRKMWKVEENVESGSKMLKVEVNCEK